MSEDFEFKWLPKLNRNILGKIEINWRFENITWKRWLIGAQISAKLWLHVDTELFRQPLGTNISWNRSRQIKNTYTYVILVGFRLSLGKNSWKRWLNGPKFSQLRRPNLRKTLAPRRHGSLMASFKLKFRAIFVFWLRGFLNFAFRNFFLSRLKLYAQFLWDCQQLPAEKFVYI